MKSKMNSFFSFGMSFLMVMTFMTRTVFAADINELIIVDGITYQVTSEKEVMLAHADSLMETEIIIPETVRKPNSDFTYTVTSIDELAFQASDITSISIPSSLQKIDGAAFGHCQSLERVSFYGDPKGTLEIGSSAFTECSSLQLMDLPENLVKIGSDTFSGCKALKTIELPDSLSIISDYAFLRCESLQSVDFPKNLKEIGASAFWGCKSLQKVELPEGLEKIGFMAFALESGEQLEYMNIPASVTTLGKNFLTGVKSDGSTALVFQGETPPANMVGALDEISNQKNKPTVYFPADALNAYTEPNSPFVTAGLINPSSPEVGADHSYALDLSESFHICPNRVELMPRSASIPKRAVLRWTSDDPKIVKVDESGKLTGVSNGTATITATISIQGVEQVSDSCKVTVGHTYNWVIDQEPTKDHAGSKYQYCVDCYHKTNHTSIPAIGYTEQVESAVYRAYNLNNGEHLYTTDYKEFMHITNNGWHDEGVAFMAEEEKNGQALYRVYNPNSGLHHYTLDEKEKNTLVSLGWRDEKVAWYTSKKPQSAPVYRVYNPNDGNHHYTMNQQEKDVLVLLGWHDEGLAFRTAPIETK